MSQNKKTQFPTNINWWVFELRDTGEMPRETVIDIHVGFYCDEQAMERTYASLISLPHMTNDILMRNLVATAKSLNRTRDRQLDKQEGNPLFLPMP